MVWLKGIIFLEWFLTPDSVAGIKNAFGNQADLSDGLFEVTLIRAPKNLIDIHRILNDFLNTQYDPEYVLILSGDHIYKMDYEVMLDFHKENNADVTIATMPVPLEEASRFGIVIADEDKRIQDFEEKPEHPRSNLASMGIYIFSWKALKEAPDCNERSEQLWLW